MNVVTCPYCEAPSCLQDDKRWRDGALFKQKCQYCDKEFVYIVYVMLHLFADQADCLNRAPHKFAEVNIYPKEAGKKRLRCVDCGEETIQEETV